MSLLNQDTNQNLVERLEELAGKVWLHDGILVLCAHGRRVPWIEIRQKLYLDSHPSNERLTAEMRNRKERCKRLMRNTSLEQMIVQAVHGYGEITAGVENLAIGDWEVLERHKIR